MSTNTKQLFIDALSLPSRTRAQLAEKLLGSLEDGEPSPEIEKAWMKEAKGRYEAFKKGKIKDRGSDAVMLDAYRRLKG